MLLADNFESDTAIGTLKSTLGNSFSQRRSLLLFVIRVKQHSTRYDT